VSVYSHVLCLSQHENSVSLWSVAHAKPCLCLLVLVLVPVRVVVADIPSGSQAEIYWPVNTGNNNVAAASRMTVSGSGLFAKTSSYSFSFNNCGASNNEKVWIL